jgi:hypothetical protein
MISSNTTANDLATLKARLSSVKEEKKSIEEEIKIAKQLAKTNKTAKPEKAPRSVSKTKQPAKPLCVLTQEDLETISAKEWTSCLISEWVNAQFPDSIDPEESNDPWPQVFLKKVCQHFDEPKSGDRTINTTIKPTLTKWTKYVTELPESTQRDEVLYRITFVSEIINQRRDFLKRERSSDIEVGSNKSQQPVKRAVTFTDGSMTNVDEKDADSSQLISAMSSLSISQDYTEHENEEILSLPLSQNPIETRPVLSLCLPLTTEEFHESSNEKEEGEDIPPEPSDEDSTQEYLTTSFVEGFKGREMECLDLDGFTSRNSVNGKNTMLIISYHSIRLATCVKGRWTYTDDANTPLAMLIPEDA